MNTTENNKKNRDMWINMFSYRDQKHRDQFVAKMATDKECQEGYKEFTKLITPGSQIITGEFKRLIKKNIVN